MFKTARYAVPMAALLVWLAPVRATDLDPKSLTYKLPAQIAWVENKTAGNAIAVLAGDPNKPGIYVILEKWYAHHNSRPHYHMNDRYITVVSGTWWVNTGPKYDPDGMVPLPTGTFVTHYGGQIHYDGAKEADCVIQISGMGPAQATRAEQP
jgi:hypothetical protein